jgi:hypothetical protein
MKYVELIPSKYFDVEQWTIPPFSFFPTVSHRSSKGLSTSLKYCFNKFLEQLCPLVEHLQECGQVVAFGFI